MYVRVRSCCVYTTVQKFTPQDVSTLATIMKHTCTHTHTHAHTHARTHTHMNACIVMNDKFVRMCMCSLGHDYGHFCHTCSPTDSTRMTSWCKWSTRETRHPLNCSRHSGSWAWLRWVACVYIHTDRRHTCTLTCLHRHTPHHTHTWAHHTTNKWAHNTHMHFLPKLPVLHTNLYSAPSRRLKPITRRSCKSTWAAPMETSCTHEEEPFSKQVWIKLYIIVLVLTCDRQ